MRPLAVGGNRVSYRRDIDGMRAVAVMLVVFDHLKLIFHGGYIGVDVFFVISGFLISSIILSEVSHNRFSIVRFYERRIRRIFPAMIATFVGTGILALLYLLPSELKTYGRSMLAANFSVSNFLFWKQAGYFDALSTTKPLLHTWSLAVEEQFYICFPLFILLVRLWFPTRIREAICTTAILSFILACFWVRFDPNTAFYIAPLRAWELLIGTIVSQGYLPEIKTAAGRNIASFTGILCILVPAILYSDSTPFPGYSALPPCVGAALIIAAGESGSSFVARILALRPVVFVGLISYSLYLWHWPILVFEGASGFLWSPFGKKFSILIASFVAAYLSWRFIETPVRKGRFRPDRRHLFLGSGIAVTAVAAASILIIAFGGFPSRFPPDSLAVASYMDFDPAAAFRQDVCFMKTPPDNFNDFKPEVCLAPSPVRKQYLLLGDSHAADLYAGLVTVFPQINFSQANSSGCQSFVNEPSQANPTCKAMANYIYGTYLRQHVPDAILLGGLWNESQFPELGETIHHIQTLGIPIILVGPNFEYDAPLPRVAAVAMRAGNVSSIQSHRKMEPQTLDRKMAALAANDWHVRYISAYDDLCAPSCPVFAGSNIPILFDNQHYTPAGATLLAQAAQAHKQLP